ncbi:MAG: hypothetical protein ACTHMG_03430 [Sphingomonas sp.]
MNYRSVSRGLGFFSIALGAAELFASRRITKALGTEGSEAVVKTFGAREVAAGVGLLQAPAHAARMWGRVAGDAIDMGALALAARRSGKRGALIGAAAFVGAVALIDTVVAGGLTRAPSIPANGPAARVLG